MNLFLVNTLIIFINNAVKIYRGLRQFNKKGSTVIDLS